MFRFPALMKSYCCVEDRGCGFRRYDGPGGGIKGIPARGPESEVHKLNGKLIS